MKVLSAGDAAALLGPIFEASPFNVEVKGFAKKPGQPVLQGIPWGECPGFEGSNRILPKKGAEVLAAQG